MDVLTVLFLLAIAFVGVWTVRTVRRVGVRRFGSALTALVGAILVSLSKLFRKTGAAETRVTTAYVGDDMLIPSNTIPGQRPGYNLRTGEYDDGNDPAGWYSYEYDDEGH